jgi:hypothetical protein
MNRILRTLNGYIWWTYDRGSLHYDVMVTAILLFVFVSPRYINFKDKPAETVLTPKGVIVSPDGRGGLFFEVDASVVRPNTAEQDLDAELLRIIEPVSGEVRILSHKESRDRYGRKIYLVQVQR